ncbi:MAG: CYTH domain-containing protein [Lachnospiraceae bacterium]|nr:CYTH domain-containing protein [Lachnospiraceae bacterium]MBR6302592.1 CYTH domain-containing protein [Lachnospiraceae bacterium]
MEIERKFLIKKIPADLESYPSKRIEQAYLNISPVVRIRREDDDYYMTYKGSGMLAREEMNLPLTKDAYYHLLLKADGNVICKRRYIIPLEHPKVVEGAPKPPDGYSLIIELDVFDEPFAPLVMAEVEFGSKEAADVFLPPDWFGDEVTYIKEFHNSNMAMADVYKDDPE